jgi:hypothetical protein
MLFSINGDGSLKQVTAIPHEREYRVWRGRISNAEFKAIYDAIRHRVRGKEIDTAGWMPGSDWRGTPYQAIYEKACNRDFDSSRRFFGIIVWVVMLEHEEAWSFGRYKVRDVPIKSMTYFQIDVPTHV